MDNKENIQWHFGALSVVCLMLIISIFAAPALLLIVVIGKTGLAIIFATIAFATIAVIAMTAFIAMTMRYSEMHTDLNTNGVSPDDGGESNA